jgi:hypothetical protein
VCIILINNKKIMSTEESNPPHTDQSRFNYLNKVHHQPAPQSGIINVSGKSHPSDPKDNRSCYFYSSKGRAFGGFIISSDLDNPVMSNVTVKYTPQGWQVELTYAVAEKGEQLSQPELGARDKEIREALRAKVGYKDLSLYPRLRHEHLLFQNEEVPKAQLIFKLAARSAKDAAVQLKSVLSKIMKPGIPDKEQQGSLHIPTITIQERDTVLKNMRWGLEVADPTVRAAGMSL